MRIRIVDAALVIATVVGGIWAVSSARKLHALQQEHTRLSRSAGDLVVTDPTQMHVLALDTGEPLHFAWRVYAPAGQTMVSESSDGGSSTSTDSSNRPREFIGRVRFTKRPTGQIVVYSTFGSGSGSRTFGSQEMFQFLLDHVDELHIEQLGAPEMVRVKPGESVTVLRISLPESLVAEASKTIGGGSSRPMNPILFNLRLELNP